MADGIGTEMYSLNLNLWNLNLGVINEHTKPTTKQKPKGNDCKSPLFNCQWFCYLEVVLWSQFHYLIVCKN